MAAYPQAPPFRLDEIEPFLKRSLIAKLGTINEDGTVHLAPIWFRYRDGELWFGSQDLSRKVRNIKHNNQVTVLIDTADPPYQAIMLYGVAELDYDDVIVKRSFIFENYMPAEAALAYAQNLAKQFEPVLIRVRPERMVTFDYGKEQRV
ncbi:MAG: pyridoxamine 5'-phosphate oxidase family protein [Chloroflexi bacterium]|nr:pyridoxamine 5'-phosphate oxidase family protein [Chloroflexota bacterium]